MKSILNKIFFAVIASAMLVFTACETEDNINITSPDPAFELKTPGISNVFLNFALPDNPAFTITWQDQLSKDTNTYEIEMSRDNTFDTPIQLGTTEGSSFSMTVTAFNDVLKDAGFSSFEQLPVHFRIKNGEKVSNSILLLVTTFAVEIPAITAPDNTSAITLSDVDPDAVATTITWEDSERNDNSAVTISYTVEVASAGSSFATPLLVAETEDLSYEVSHGALNSLALTAGLAPEASGMLDIRVRATTETAAGDLIRTSATVTFAVTPYDVALPPALFVVGAGAVDAGWAWTSPVELPLQGTVYSGNIRLTPNGGGNFRFFTVRDDWGSGQNYTYYADRGYTFDANLTDANDGDNNFLFTGAEGEYFIEIDTVNETITLGPPVVGPNCVHDQLWVVGAGAVDAGWGWTSPVRIRCTGNGLYQGNINLTNDAFRFFTVRDDWGSGQNYPFFANDGYTINSDLVNANDGDSNFRFAGTPGEYFLTVDTVNKEIKLEPKNTSCEFVDLWIVGAGVPDAGWGWSSPIQFSCVDVGLYSATVTFANDAFRFFTVRDDWGSGRNYPFYETEGYTIDANFENANDGDSNFRFVGTPGTYTLYMDTIAKTITLE
ncbi:SusE domain-containing protein [uncultured Tenacibaculum sp.]|uniref:SusE domain-containing protein n=1 Tax=uncultured Tenacibaculum sp. TaxID=174713 RepID=UPI00262602EE|nr:SusE domain-containing protein [uncultured Tenacibaculum sp.]